MIINIIVLHFFLSFSFFFNLVKLLTILLGFRTCFIFFLNFNTRFRYIFSKLKGFLASSFLSWLRNRYFCTILLLILHHSDILSILLLSNFLLVSSLPLIAADVGSKATKFVFSQFFILHFFVILHRIRFVVRSSRRLVFGKISAAWAVFHTVICITCISIVSVSGCFKLILIILLTVVASSVFVNIVLCTLILHILLLLSCKYTCSVVIWICLHVGWNHNRHLGRCIRIMEHHMSLWCRWGGCHHTTSGQIAH
mmetsp:Transcript_57155/g.78527  ORF Transcript_57155/g.78527 Transcript_57155/m.78527 type:complete len:254 (-) Transcript_57155:1222-1983(-)